eukprot:1891748-Prymnesium_polylepis.1
MPITARRPRSCLPRKAYCRVVAPRPLLDMALRLAGNGVRWPPPPRAQRDGTRLSGHSLRCGDLGIAQARLSIGYRP